MLTLWEALKEECEWTGSLDDLVLHSNSLVESFQVGPGTHLPPRTRSTAMDYRSQKIVSPAKGKSFAWLHLVQFCAARYLVEHVTIPTLFCTEHLCFGLNTDRRCLHGNARPF